MVTAPLQVERCQIQGASIRQYKELLGQLLVHQLLLDLQLGWSCQEASHYWVQTT